MKDMKDIMKIIGFVVGAVIGYAAFYALTGWLASVALAWPFLKCVCGVIALHLLGNIIGYTVKGLRQ